MEVEEVIAVDAPPPAVRAGLQAKAGKGKLLKAGSITKQGKLVAYEARVVRDEKRSEVRVGPNAESPDHKE